MDSPRIEWSSRLRRAAHDELVRRSFVDFHTIAFGMLHGDEAFIPGNHIDAMGNVLTRLASGEHKRQIITLPPRHGKSEISSASFPAWILGRDPSAKVVIASYGQELSSHLVDKARTIVKHPRYQRVFPGTVIKRGKDRAEHFETTAGGSVRAASRAGAMTGLGTHYLIVDDWQKAGEVLSPTERYNATELFKSTFQMRFDNLIDGRILIVQQRLHDDDLVGWALTHGRWEHLNLPGIAVQDEQIPLSRGRMWHRRSGDVLAPALASRATFAELLTTMGPRDYEAQVQGNPGCGDGGLFEWGWFDTYDERPARNFFHKVVQSIDPASSDSSERNSWSAGLTFGYREGEWYLLDHFRVQEKFNELCDRVKAWHYRWRADALLVERSSNGPALVDVVKKARLPGIIRAPHPILGKIARLEAASVHLREGVFRVPSSAPWLPEFRRELLGFPNSSSSDQVDALTQFIGFVFHSKGWVEAEFDASGRRMRIDRPVRRPRFYDGEVPSARSWDPRE